MPTRSVLAVAAALALPLAAHAAVSAKTPQRPSARTIDRNADGRIDGVRLTFPTAVTLTRKDVKVAGWKVRAVKSSGKTALVTLKPRKTHDSGRHPRVRVPGTLLTARDGARPVPVRASLAGSTLAIVWSERLTRTTCARSVRRVTVRGSSRGAWRAITGAGCRGTKMTVRVGDGATQLRYRAGGRTRVLTIRTGTGGAPGGGGSGPGGSTPGAPGGPGTGGNPNPPPAPTSPPPITSETKVWNPLAQQTREPDTLYMLDPAHEKTLVPGDGGLIAGNAPAGDLPWKSDSKVKPVAGKFTEGLQSVDRSYGYLWMPGTGVLPADEFTIEMWLKASTAWSGINDDTPFAFAVGDGQGSGVSVEIRGGEFFAHFAHQEGATAPVNVSLTKDLSSVPAGTWKNVSLTYKDNTFRLYLDGVLAASRSGVTPPSLWSDTSRSAGLTLAGSSGRGATQMTISDVRISRRARTPGQSLTVDDANVLNVDTNAPTGKHIQQRLLGGLHTLTTPATEQRAKGVLKVLRTDKLLVATPIKAGAPDATHASAGVSGAYSYDWQVVDRTFDYMKRQGIEPYISIDALPQILGGSVAPYSGTRLTSDRSWTSAFPAVVVTDSKLPEWSKIVRDLVHHVLVEKHYVVPYWGVWNEPDGPEFWPGGSIPQYLALYKATVLAVRAVDPTAQVGGPEIAHWKADWITQLIQYCKANSLPLDFISWHYYNGNLQEIARVRAEVNRIAAANGVPAPSLLMGEWTWQPANFNGTGQLPWRNLDYHKNDWHAAYAGASLIEMQRVGVLESIYTYPTSEPGARGWDSSGLMASAYPWANWNVFKLWSMLAPDVVSTQYKGRPSVLGLASKDSSGRTTILVSNLHYQRDGDLPLRVKLPASMAGSPVRDYLIDDKHSDAFDAGVGHAELEHVQGSTVDRDGLTWTTLRPRSVHLLVVG